MTNYCKLRQLRKRWIDELAAQSGLDENLIDNVIVYVESLAGESNEIKYTTFITQMAMHFNLSSSFMLNLIFNAAQKSRKHPKKTIAVDEYSRLMCIFLSKNLDAKINFVFTVYDTNANNVIDRTEVYTLLKPTVIQEDEDEEMLKELIEMVMKSVDHDGVSKINLEKFRELVKKNVLYIELLGQCLPADKYVRRFVQKISEKTALEVREMAETEAASSVIASPYKIKKNDYYPINLDYTTNMNA